MNQQPAPVPQLTDRQVDVLAGAARGERHEYTAQHLGLAANTVKAHRAHAMAALGAESMAHGIALAIAYGHLPADTALTTRSET